jgi:4-amino-4-deoxy-L-arabinose transferase-like glycosyltransferase
LAALVFPWTAHLSLMVAEAVTRGWSGLRKDPRRVFLLAWIVPVVAFFSLSKGKLPGYVLVTVPALAIWMGNQLSTVRARWLRWVFLAQAAMFLLVLPAAQVLPTGLAEGARAALQALSRLHPDRWLAWLTTAGAVLIVFAAWRGRRLAACLLATALMAAALSRVIAVMAPAVDSLASARPLARLIRQRGIPPSQLVLMPGVHRTIEYGLGFYLDYPMKLGTAGPYLVTADGRIVPAGPRQGK